MRTSPKQFEIMVDFMERNGDLSRFGDGPESRIKNMLMWRKLSCQLNAEKNGTVKSTDKWKKVWSDFKNNTKRKYIKMQRAANSVDGTVSKLVLTDLEQRLLRVIKQQPALLEPRNDDHDIKPVYILKPVTNEYRTTSKQFEIMVDFMERHGDINKPDGSTTGVENMKLWVELRGLLNAETSDLPKSIKKWRKVWSDFKLHCKRKAAKISQSGVNGAPETNFVLTNVEQRVIKVLGYNPPIPEDNIEYLEEPIASIDVPFATIPGSFHTELTDEDGSRDAPAPASPARSDTTDDSLEDPIKPEMSGQPTLFQEAESESSNSPTPHQLSAPNSSQSRLHRRTSLSDLRKRNTPRPTQSQPITIEPEQFLASDVEWRNLATEFVIENARLRRRELQQQRQWQGLFSRLLDILERFTDKKD